VSGLKAYRVILSIESSAPFHDYTGKVVKTLVYSIAPELTLMHGVKGVLSPLTISPPFTIGKSETELGEPVIPIYEKVDKDGENGAWSLKPVELNGEYIVHLGGLGEIASTIARRLEELRTPLAVKIGNSIVRYRVENVIDVTPHIMEKADSVSNRVRVYLKSPAQVFNVFAPTRLPKFTTSAVEVLMTPYMLANGIHTIDHSTLVNASRVLGQLVETWYSINTLRPVMVPFKGKREVALAGHVTYIVEATNGRTLEEIRRVLATAEIAGVGRSRQNGFGITVISI
jgi:hypothetical protein